MNMRKVAILTSFLGLCGVGRFYADASPSVLVIGPVRKDLPKSSRSLLSITKAGHVAVAQVQGNVVYGSDENSVVVIQTRRSDVPKGSGFRMIVIDHGTLNTIVDTNLTGSRPVEAIQLTLENMVVRSKETTVYFTAFDGKSFSVTAANWISGTVRKLQVVDEENKHSESGALVGEPFGFAVPYSRMAAPSVIAVFDSTEQKTVLRLANTKRGRFRLYSVPNVGLMEYFDGVHFRLTEADFRTAILDPVGYPSSIIGPHAKIFERTIDGEPFLIWGKGTNETTLGNHSNDEITFLNLNSKVEATKPLGGEFSSHIRPDSTGNNIYFADQKGEKIFVLHRQSGEIDTLGSAQLQGFGEQDGSAMVVAN